MDCTLFRIQHLLGKRWTLLILQALSQNTSLNFNQLKKKIKNPTNTILTHQLNELEKEELVQRTVLREKPVRVAYALTQKGKDIIKIWHLMKKFGTQHALVPHTCLKTNCNECISS